LRARRSADGDRKPMSILQKGSPAAGSIAAFDSRRVGMRRWQLDADVIAIPARRVAERCRGRRGDGPCGATIGGPRNA